MSAACSRGDLRQARPPHPTTTPPPPRSPRLAYAAEPCDKEIDQARPSPTDPADLPRYHRRGDPRHRHCGPAGGRKAGTPAAPPFPPPPPGRGPGGAPRPPVRGGRPGGKRGADGPPHFAPPVPAGGFREGPPGAASSTRTRMT